MLAFLEHPDELARLQADPGLLDPAVEEILRFEPAVHHFRRTATEDTEIRGRKIKQDDPVLIWYPAAITYEDKKLEGIFAQEWRAWSGHIRAIIPGRVRWTTAQPGPNGVGRRATTLPA